MAHSVAVSFSSELAMKTAAGYILLGSYLLPSASSSNSLYEWGR